MIFRAKVLRGKYYGVRDFYDKLIQWLYRANSLNTLYAPLPLVMPTVRFNYNGQVTEVQTEADKTILQIALDNGIPVEHACGGNGFCTTCMCKVKNGMEHLSERNDKEENMGIDEDPDRLSCQARVQGDVEIEVLDM